MFNIVDKIKEFFSEILIDMIKENLSGMLLDINDKVSTIANEVGKTPSGWNSGVCEKFCVSAPPDRLWADIFLIFKKYTFITKIWKFRYL